MILPFMLGSYITLHKIVLSQYTLDDVNSFGLILFYSLYSRGAAEATGLSFVCFAITPRVLSANRVNLGFFIFQFYPPPQICHIINVCQLYLCSHAEGVGGHIDISKFALFYVNISIFHNFPILHHNIPCLPPLPEPHTT